MSTTTVALDVRGVSVRRHLRVVTSAEREPAAGVPEAPPTGRPGSGDLRLTRRGRVVVAALGWTAIAVAGALLVLVAVLAFGGRADAGERPGAAAASTEYVVLPGETLWGIAAAAAPDQDPREVIARIVELNALPGVEISAGQRLFLPGDL